MGWAGDGMSAPPSSGGAGRVGGDEEAQREQPWLSGRSSRQHALTWFVRLRICEVQPRSQGQASSFHSHISVPLVWGLLGVVLWGAWLTAASLNSVAYQEAVLSLPFRDRGTKGPVMFSAPAGAGSEQPPLGHQGRGCPQPPSLGEGCDTSSGAALCLNLTATYLGLPFAWFQSGSLWITNMALWVLPIIELQISNSYSARQYKYTFS